MVKRRTTRGRNALKSLFASLFREGDISSSAAILDPVQLRIEHLEERRLLTVSKLYVPQDLTGQVGNTITVPIQILVTQSGGITLNGADIAATYDTSKFTVSNARRAPTLVTAGFAATFETTTPGVLKFTASSDSGVALPLNFNDSLFLVDFTIIAGTGTTSIVDLEHDVTGTVTALFQDIDEITLVPAPTNNNNDAVDGLITIGTPNAAPTADAGGPYTVSEGSTVTLSAAGTTDNEQSAATLTYQWDLDNDGTFGETGGAAGRGNETGIGPTYNAAGVNGPSTITVTVRAVDSGGLSSTDTASISVTNVAPSANAGGPYTVFEGATTSLSGTGSDPVDSIILEWDLDGDGAFGETGGTASRGNETGNTPIFTAGGSPGLDGPTTATVTLRVREANASTTSTAVVNVANQVPTANAGGPYTVAEGSSTSLIADGTDVPGDPLNFTWDLDGDGTFGETGGAGLRGNETGPAPTFSAAGFSGLAVVTVTVRATDGDGGSATATTTVTVTNVNPTSVPGGPYTVAEGGTTSLSGTGTDPVDTVTFAWDLDGDTTFGESGGAAARGNESGASVIFNAAGVSGPATVTVTLRTTDADGASTTATTTVVVTNVAPTANANGPYTVAEGATTSMAGTATDPVDSVTFTWDFDGDTTFGETGAGATRGIETGANAVFNAAGLSGPTTVTVTMRATDTDGLSSTSTATISVTNVAPTANAGGPYNVAEGSTTILNGTGTDPVDTLTFQWDLDNDGTFGETGGAAARGNETGASTIFSAAGLTAPATLTVTFRSLDGDGASTTATTIVTVTNTVPTTDAGGPYTVAEGSSTTLSGTGFDAGGPVTLTWDLDNDGNFGETGGAAGRGNETGASPTYSAVGVNGTAQITVTIRATDSGGTSVTDTAVIVVTNVAPTANAGGPYTVAEGSATGLVGTGSDPVDSISFTWDLDSDGTFGETGGAASFGNETGATPTFNAATISGPHTATVTVRVTDTSGASTTATTTVQVTNVAPTANTSGPYTVAEGGSTTVVGSGSDPVDSISFSWDLDGDGTFGETGGAAGRGNETGSSATFSAAGLGGPSTSTITVRVTDANGAATDATTTVVVTNVAPTPSAGGPYGVSEGASTTLSGTATDPVDSVSLLWDLDGDGTFGETGGAAGRGNETGNNPSFNAASITGPATRTVTLRATDSDGASTTATALINISNVAPNASAGGPYTVAEGGTVGLFANGSDPGSIVTFTWDLDNDGTFGETGGAAARGNETTDTPIFNAAGVSGPATVTVTVRVTDSGGSSSTATASITVTNVAPTALPGGPYTVAEGSSTTLSGSGTDPVDSVTLSWDLDGDGTFGETGGAAGRGNETGSNPSFNAAGVSGAATVTVTLRATDANSAINDATTTIVVTNVAPTPNAGGPYAAAEGGSTTLSGTATDPVDSVSLLWDLDGDGTFGETGGAASRGNETGNNPTFNAAGITGPTTRTVTLRATDADGASTTATALVNISNVAPSASAGGPYTVAEGGTTGLTGSGSDPGSSVTVTWDLDGDGTFGETGGAAGRGNETGSTSVFNAAGLSGPATVTVTVRVTDTGGSSSTATASITVNNVAPTALPGGPYTVAEGSSTTLSGSGTDPVDSVTLSWDLDGDGTFGETGGAAGRGNETGSNPSFNAAGVSGAATVTVTLRATDANSAINDATTTIVVTNVAPTPNAGGPYAAAEGGSTTLSGTATDPVDSVSLLWDLDGDGTFGETGGAASRGNETGNSPTFNAAGITGPTTRTVTLRATDADGASTTATALVNISNVAPSASAGGPYTVAEGGTTGLTGSGSDPGSSVTVIWDLDGDGTFGETGGAAGRGNETGSTSVFNAAGVSGPATVTVTVRVSDTGGSSSTATASITVNNVAPTALPGGPYTVAEGSSTTLSGSGTDPVDSVTLSWDLDGDGTFGETGGAAGRGNETGSNPTFNAAGVSGPATITVTLRATDANSAIGDATTTIIVNNVPPTANAGGPYTVAEGSATGLSGTGTDPVDLVTFTWDLDGDGTFGETGGVAGRGNETGPTPTFNAAGLSGPATVTVTLRSTDANGASATSTSTVVVTNVAPIASAGGPYNVIEGGTTTLSGTGTDPVDAVTLLWDLDNDGTFGETGGAAGRGNETGANPIFNSTGLTGGASVTVTVRAIDTDGASSTSTTTVTVSNTAPTAEANGPYTVSEGGTTTLAGTGADAGGSVVLTWDLDGDGTFGETGAAAGRGNETGTNPIYNAAGLSGPATVTITVRATDTSATSTNDTATVTITNVSPSANAGGPYTVAEGAATTLSGTGTDPVDTVTLTWDLDGDGTFGETGGAAGRGNETGTNPSFSAAALSGPATITITVRATDADELSTNATTTVVVTNVAPTAGAGGPYTVAEGSATNLSGTGTDPVDGVVLTWDLDNDGTFGELGGSAGRGDETGAAPTFSAAGLSGPATVTITVRATDDNGASTTATTTVVVTNVAPTAGAGGPYTVAEGGATGLSGTGTDPVDSVSLVWDLDNDGTFGETGGAAGRGNETGATPTFSAASLGGPATVTITVRATDANGASSTATTTVTVTNVAPTAEANGPYTVTEGGTTGLTGTGTDPVDSITLTWDLDGDGTFGETGGAAGRGNETGSTPTFNAAGVNGPATVTITVRANDGAASTTDTAIVVVNNAPPTANAGGPYTVAEGSTTTLSGTGSDPVDNVKLTWDLDGDGTFGETGAAAGRGNETGANPTFNAAGLSGPATLTITVRAADCDMAVANATTTVVVTNVPPTADAGGPYSAAEGATVQLSGTGTDPADSVTLTWDLDGDGTFGETGGAAGRGNETGANPVYNTAGISGPAAVPVTLRVTDANGASVTDTAVVNIENVPPTADAGGPYTVVEGGSTQLAGTGSDSSGSVVLTWDLDGDGTFGETGGAAGRGNETGATPTFTPTGLNGPATVTITIVATDTSGASTTDTATVLVTNAAPTTSAGGPYSVAEGGTTTLAGTGSDLSGAISLDWDLDGDGTFGETGGAAGRGNETGTSPTYSAVGLDGPTTRTVTVRATDNDGASTTATALVNISNVAPTVDAGGPYAVAAGGSVALTGVGGPTFSDPGVPDTHTVVWDLDGDGTFGETGAAAGRGNETGLNPTFLANNAFGQVVITLRVTDDDGGTSQDTAIVTVAGAQFDFNHDFTPLSAAGTPSPTQAGYTGVMTRDTYNATAGFGWTVSPGSFDRGAINTTSLPDMRRDGHYGTRNLANVANPNGARTFRADLPNGSYAVNVTMGDNLVAHDNMRIKAEVGQPNQLILPLVANLAGQFVHTSFSIVVTDGHLDLEFSDEGGANLDWVLNGIEIRPTAIDSIVFSPPGEVVADGVTPTVFTATTALAEGTLVTITTNVGTVTTTDADPAQPPVNGVNQPSWAGTQVKVIGGQITFSVVSTSTTPVTVRAVSVNGLAEGTATANVGLPDLRRYDFNATAAAGGTLVTAPNYASVVASNTYSPALGFGWLTYNSSIDGEFQRNGAAANNAPLRRDGHFGSGAAGRTFQIAVTPGIQYNVRVYVGDLAVARNNIAVTVEGAVPPTPPNAPSYTIVSLAAGAFDTRPTTAPLSASDDGLLTINIRGTTGGTWVANGIDIWEVGTPDPGAAQLQAADIAIDGASGAALTSEDLAPIVSEAITRWTATGLSPAQVAALQATQFQIVDLGDAHELGNAQPGLVQIDDDAAGHGWYIDSTPADDDEFAVSIAATERQAQSGAAAGRMDLLTLVMHELGHELGLEDLAAGDSHGLMTENIGAGVRRTPAANDAAGVVPPLFTTQSTARDQVFADLSSPSTTGNKPQAAPTTSAPSVLSSFFASNRVSRPSARQKPGSDGPKQS